MIFYLGFIVMVKGIASTWLGWEGKEMRTGVMPLLGIFLGYSLASDLPCH
jgi:hypothetical protein